MSQGKWEKQTLEGWGTAQRGDPELCPQGMSALGLDLVHAVETESSLKGCPATRHLAQGREPPWRDIVLSQRSEMREAM